MNENLTPKAIVAALDAHIIGQPTPSARSPSRCATAGAVSSSPPDLRDEVTPKNILMIGPTGVGKTEISRRLAKLADAPFIKVEATKFTEVGYVGRDVEQIIRDLVEVGIGWRRSAAPRREGQGGGCAEERGARCAGRQATAARRRAKVSRSCGPTSSTRRRSRSRSGTAPAAAFEIPGMPAADDQRDRDRKSFGKAMGSVEAPHADGRAAWDKLVEEESDKLLDSDQVSRTAHASPRRTASSSSTRSTRSRSATAAAVRSRREGVQRDLLPLIEGTTVSTKYGPVKTDHILFIASGAFHIAKPSDLLPELQGRLPIRVELKALTRDDLRAS
jgi:ATP-dependent HslUV protease ATP-binding subunit HslU